MDEAQHLDRSISSTLLNVFRGSSVRRLACMRQNTNPPIGLSAVPGAGGTVTWYLGPTRVAARGKMRSSGSVRRCQPPAPQKPCNDSSLSPGPGLSHPHTPFSPGARNSPRVSSANVYNLYVCTHTPREKTRGVQGQPRVHVPPSSPHPRGGGHDIGHGLTRSSGRATS